MKESQSWKNHSGDLFACYVEPYNQETNMHIFHMEINNHET